MWRHLRAAPAHGELVRVRPDDGHTISGQGEQAVVHQQDRSFDCHLAGERPPSRVILLPLLRRRGAPLVEQADPPHEAQQVAHLPVDHRLVHDPVADGGGQGRAEPGGRSGHLEIEAGERRRRGRVRAEPVRHDDAVEAPLFPQDPPDQVGLLAAVGPVHLVVGGHHGPDAGLPDGVFERNEVDLPQGALGDLGADGHPFVLLVVADEVLDTAPDPAALHPLDVGDGEAGRQQRVLGEGLEGAPGQRRAHDAYRRPQHHVDALRACFGGQHCPQAPDQLGVPRRPDRRAAGQRQGTAADQAVAPDPRRPVGHLERRETQPLDGREVPQVGAGGEGALLIEGHLAEEDHHVSTKGSRRPGPTDQW